MDKKVRWNKRALDNFENIAQYLEEVHSIQAAENFVSEVFAKIEVLKKYPTIGRKAPKRKTVRFVLVGKYRRLYYRTSGRHLIISSIFDTRQHPKGDIHQ